MEIKINDKPVSTHAKCLSELAEELALPTKGVAVAVDFNMIPRTEWEKTLITEGASVFIVKAVCGG